MLLGCGEVASKALFSNLGGSWVTTFCMSMEDVEKVSESRRMGAEQTNQTHQGATIVLGIDIKLPPLGPCIDANLGLLASILTLG